MRTALVALGSNLGATEANVRAALETLRATYTELRASSLYRTKPVGCEPGAPDYVNACATFKTDLSPEDLLGALRSLETRAGRPEARRRNEDRTLDIDIIAIEGVERSTEVLTLPHPRAAARAFVVVPAMEVAPEFSLGSVSVREAHAKLPASQVAELVHITPTNETR